MTAAASPRGDRARLDKVLDRLRESGPERVGWLSNHAPMAVAALTRAGHCSSSSAVMPADVSSPDPMAVRFDRGVCVGGTLHLPT